MSQPDKNVKTVISTQEISPDQEKMVVDRS